MTKPNWTLETNFFISLLIFTSVLFSYPKILTQFFFDQGITNFFISDLNVFTQIYIYNNFFLIYLVYRPFFIIIVLLWSSKLASKESGSFGVRIGLGFIYFHFLAVYRNQFIFSVQSQQDITFFFDNKIQALDLNYMIRQYYGFYWDFFLISYAYFGCFTFVTEKPWSRFPFIYNLAYSVPQKKSDFWSPFCIIWGFRFISVLFNFYFFGAQSFFADMLLLVCSFIAVEIAIFSHRFFVILQRLKL